MIKEGERIKIDESVKVSSWGADFSHQDGSYQHFHKYAATAKPTPEPEQPPEEARLTV